MSARVATSTSTLRVIHAAPTWLPQTQTWMHTQLQHLPPEIEPHVVCGRTENLGQFPVEHMHCLGDSPLRLRFDQLVRASGLRRELGHLRSVAREVGATVLHSHFGHIGWKNIHAARRAGLAHVVTFYGQDATYLPKHEPRWLERYAELFESVDLVLTEGAHFAGTIRELGCPAEKVRVQHLGIELGRLVYRPRRWDPGEPLKVLLAGTFTEKKGLPYAIEALASARDGIDLETTLIGDAGADPRHAREKDRILDAIERTGLAVRMLGFQTHEALYEEAYRNHVFLSPSVLASDGDSEGGAPMTLVELAATGMPVVSTTHCDIPEVVGSDGSELLASERDVGGLTARLLWLASDPAMWAGLVAGVRGHLAREYDAVVQGRRLAEIYAEVAG